ncbi:MAG: VCBS repeat-containing protein [Verrucomicrobiales bacterium]|nr:VCBS repeat-containing protein [Verrucomicrobiales bacterium]
MTAARRSPNAKSGFPTDSLGAYPPPRPARWLLLTWAVGALVLIGCNKPSDNPPAAAPGAPTNAAANATDDGFLKLSNSGRNYYERGEAEKAVKAFQEALRLQPSNLDAVLNYANALLIANQAEAVLQQAEAALALDPNQPAAYYLIGCASLRLGRFEPAVKALQNAKNIDRTINEVSFQLGRAHQGMNQHEAAAAEFEEVVRFAPQHPAAHYALSQSLLRIGRAPEAQTALAEHQKVNAGKPAQITDPALFERCKYTQARVPFRQSPPAQTGIAVRFAEASSSFFGPAGSQWRGPAAVVDFGGARNSLLVRESEQAFRIMANSNGTFHAAGASIPAKPGVRYARALVGDLNNDRADDILLLGEGGSHALRITTNGVINDATGFANLRSLSATNGVLLDHLFTGNLGLVTVGYGSENVRFLRNLGSMYFSTNSTNIGIPAGLKATRQVVADDWNGDDLLDLLLQRDGEPPLLLLKQSGGPLISDKSPTNWPVAKTFVTGDVDNDSRTDLVCVNDNGIVITPAGQSPPNTLPTGPGEITAISLIDYDNDGWLDIVTVGDRVRAWRNRWTAGFVETTTALGLDQTGAAAAVRAVDFDNDGDLDFLLTRADQTLSLWRNDGGNTNQLLKVRLVGNRSNASGIGVKVEVATAGLRLARRVLELPVEIGVGSYTQLDSLNARWFTLNLNTVDVKVDPKHPIRLDELTISDTSCPYLYAWDGEKFRFVTDILGAAPIGLPIAAGRYIEADADEFVWIGDERSFRPKDGSYLLSITEELREVLYLDEARLVVVDHPEGTEVHPTDKLLPSSPFPPSELITLERRTPLLKATRLDGVDVTQELQVIDGRKVAPVQLREPQLRGLAEPHGVVLDFGPLATHRPLVLALTGWLRFGGGMANMAASLYPDLPFPFPVLEVETARGEWRKVDLQPGAPIGKTKTILVDLSGKLPEGARRIRLSNAFELYWDRIALFERRAAPDTQFQNLWPSSTDLRWRGFGDIADLPAHEPQTPLYDRVQANPSWRVSPGGWATRYGSVDDLVHSRDNRLVLINSGDELMLKFPAASIPPKPPGMQRDFFLYSVGWEKDGDFHVAKRLSFEPLPWHGMNDQLHGLEPRPAMTNDAWIQKYNTRWCAPEVLTRRNP